MFPGSVELPHSHLICTWLWPYSTIKTNVLWFRSMIRIIPDHPLRKSRRLNGFVTLPIHITFLLKHSSHPPNGIYNHRKNFLFGCYGPNHHISKGYLCMVGNKTGASFSDVLFLFSGCKIPFFRLG